MIGGSYRKALIDRYIRSKWLVKFIQFIDM